ncbi:MAG: hypothetical protein ACOYXB_07165 [Bacteroidota bacterium]
MKRILILISVALFTGILAAQNPFTGTFDEVILRTPLGNSSSLQDMTTGENPRMTFIYENPDEVAELLIKTPVDTLGGRVWTLLPSGDYEIVDPLLPEGGYFRAKVRFTNLNEAGFLRFVISMSSPADSAVSYTIPLLPLSRTSANFFVQSDEMFLGEEKIFELVSNNPGNIRINTDWVSNATFDYRVEKKFDQLYLHVVPKMAGLQQLNVSLQTLSPVAGEKGEITDRLPVLSHTFDVRRSRLRFLQASEQEITYNDANRKTGIEFQLTDDPKFELSKTYRIENQEEPGGALIAEIFTRSRLSNNKILCLLRVYNYHRNAEGYLYIKDNDQAISLTNFNVTPEMNISRISVSREGQDWSGNLNVYPGETVDVKLEGEGLNKARFMWMGATDLTPDTVLHTEQVALFRLKIPNNISTRTVPLFNKGENTGKGLNIKEYQEPRNFDFVTVNYGAGDRTITNLGGPVIYDKVIKDILIDFSANKIDSENKFYGNQYMDIDVKITGKNNELIELKTIPAIAVCPGEQSPRHPYYYKKDCIQTGVSLNKYLSRKTYDMDDWVRIQLTFRHENEKYESRGLEQTVEIIVQKQYRFDVDVSFPAGLIIKRFGDNSGDYSNFGGISMAMIAQFSFYDPERIGKFKPYKVGAGFLALNAFNFSETADRDVALVVLGSVYPTRKDAKLSFPLYMGGGYFLGSKKGFILLGPGIRISL